MIERAVEINAENDRLRGREKEVEEENAKHLNKKEQLENERLDELSSGFLSQELERERLFQRVLLRRHHLKTLIGEREAKIPAEERRVQQVKRSKD